MNTERTTNNGDLPEHIQILVDAVMEDIHERRMWMHEVDKNGNFIYKKNKEEN